MKPENCPHDEDSLMWTPCVNEEGWKCLDCGAMLGYRPDLDESRLDEKVAALLTEMHVHDLAYVSNGEQGHYITMGVAEKLDKTGHRDQMSILRAILNDPNMVCGEPGEFWKKRGDEWRAKQ